ncbi:hypothetical protein FHS39_002590 [Streptomyces olivoverticillatus]|uniref:Uncharacterized protein n=1 Tax=Streptomyces olivoverticillatus TaxID=66427 RepID=A0A7W7LNL5_9ACTN|nr:hypothetical protein [Streptomyces olivoverticillatus]MBB4893559.1 hypothetical protein [Streptomyces olivoverticillatus]
MLTQPLCVVHLFKGKAKPAVTGVKGYTVCQKHLSFQDAFFRQWEIVQDPKQDPKKG